LAGALIDSISFLLAFPFPFPVRHADFRLERGHEHGHGPAFHARRRLDGAMRTELIGELI
jgi:hypothetical protein